MQTDRAPSFPAPPIAVDHLPTIDRIVQTLTVRFATAALHETSQCLRAGLESLGGFPGVVHAELWEIGDLDRSLVSVDRCRFDGPEARPARTAPVPLALLQAGAPALLHGLTFRAPASDEPETLFARLSPAGLNGDLCVFALRAAGRLTGLLSVSLRPGSGALEPQVGSALQTLASLFAMALHRQGAALVHGQAVLRDPLTGLANRSLLLDRIESALARSVRSGDNVAVLLVDLDGFRHVNDTLGHTTGDELLGAVARRLRLLLRDADTLARLGGDEFAVVAETSADPVHAVTLAVRVVEALRVPLPVEGHEVPVTASVGLAVANAQATGTTEALTVLRQAEIAMFRAKAAGRDRLEIFADEMDADVKQRLALLDELRRAVREGEITTWFQPVVDLACGTVVSFEALARWDHPIRGLVLPGEFIPLAEGSGVIHELGSAVLDLAVGQLTAWRGAGTVGPDVAVSVNVTVRQLLSMTFVDAVDATLRRHRLPPDLLHLEFPESVFADAHLVSGPLVRLRRLGVGIAVDDFGTGHTPLSQLRDLPVDSLKIDRSLVAGLGTGGRDRALVGSVLAMAVELGFDVVAKGVETAEQLAALAEMRCRRAQGFLLGRPGPAAELPIASAGCRRP